MNQHLLMDPRQRKRPLKIFAFGLLLFLMTLALLFIMSMITNSEQPVDFWWVGAVIAVLVALISRWFSRRLHATTSRQALTHGIVWAIMLAAILLITAIPNGTIGTVFGQWPTYLIFIGVTVGPLLMKPKTTSMLVQRM